jgi:DNA polymerase III alpha subunit
MPDFDVDFCQANRDRVIDYVKDRYGRDAVSQIATFGTMAARAAIRDVGRVLDMSYTFCDGISKLIPTSRACMSRSSTRPIRPRRTTHTPSRRSRFWPSVGKKKTSRP